MKKILFVLSLLIVLEVNALEKSVFDYSNGIDGLINQKTITTKFDINDKDDSYVISSSTGIYIKNKEDYRYIDTNQSPVSVIVVDDINKDNIKDIVYAVNSEDGFYNVVAISGKDDSVLWSSILTEKKSSYDLNNIMSNINIYKIEKVGNYIVVISDYSIYVLNIYDGEFNFKYKDKDNIWDVTEVKDINNNLNEEIALSNQLGEIKLIDSNTGKLLWSKKLIDDFTFKKDGKEYSVKRNIWQVEFFNDNLYAIGEDGTLFLINRRDGKTVNKLSLYKMDKEKVEQYYSSETSSWRGGYSPTNKTTQYFNNFEMFFKKDELIVSAFFNALDRDKDYSFEPKVIVVDLKSFKINNEVIISNLKLVNIEPLDLNNNLFVPIEINNGKLIIGKYDYSSGKKVDELEIFVGSNIIGEDNKKIFINEVKEGILIEKIDNFSYILDSNLSKIIGNNNSYSSADIIKSNNEELIVSYKSNGIIYKIARYDGLDKKEPNWEYFIPDDIKNNGLFSISVTQDFNKDGIDDITALLNKIDDENRIIATYFLILDSNTGEVINFKSIFTGSYILNGKKINTYLTGNNLSAIKDMNGDKIGELLLDSTIVNGSKISIYGILNSYLNTEFSKLLNIGDINNDSISDVVAIEKSQAILFTSKKSGSMIEYVKTNKKYGFPNDVQNQDYAMLIPDLNNDGINEIVINDWDKNKKQLFRILSGKDLSTLFVIDNISYMASYSFLNKDINDDGYNDFIKIENGFNYEILSGKDGSSLYKIEQNINKEIPYYPIEKGPMPDSGDSYYEGLIMFNYDQNNNSIISGIDINNDNKEEIFILKEEYYPQVKLILEIYDIHSKNNTPLRTVDFYYSNEQNKGNMEYYYDENIYYKQITKVINGDDLFIIKAPGNNSVIYDAKEDKILSEINVSIVKAIKISKNTIFGVTSSNSPISINYTNDLVVNNLKSNNKYKSPLSIALNKASKEDMRVIKVFNEGTLLATEYSDNFELKLKRGEYNLIFKAVDRWGKTQNYSINVTINKFNPYIIIFSILAILGILMLLYLSIGHKLRRKYAIRRIYG